MKKIIAMLLCVAMVAAMGISALADIVYVPVSALQSGMPAATQAIEIAGQIFDDATKIKTGVAGYAAQLGGAKKAYAKAVKEYNELLGNIADAAKAAQYAAVASYYNAANVIADINVQMAIEAFQGQVIFDTYKAVADAVYDNVYDADGNKLYGNAYQYMAATWPEVFNFG